MHEDIPILNFLVPKAFTHDNGKLTGVMFEKVKAEYDAKGRRNLVPTGEPDQTIACDDVLVAVGQENAFPWIERDVGIEFDKWDMPKVDTKTFASTNPKVFFGGDAAFGPKNIIWAVAHGHDAALSIHKMLLRRGHHRAAAARRADLIAEDGHPRVELRQRHFRRQALQGAAPREGDRAEGHPRRGRAGLRPQARLRRGAALPELRRPDRVHLAALHRMRRLRRHLPDGLHHLHAERRRGRPADAAAGALDQPDAGPLRRRRPEDRPGDGEGRGRLPALRPLRRALPHRCVGHAEVSHRHDPRR